MAEEYLHSPVLTGYDTKTGRPVMVPAGSKVSELKGLSDEDLQQLRDGGTIRAEKYEPTVDNSTVPAAATVEEIENGADGPRATVGR